MQNDLSFLQEISQVSIYNITILIVLFFSLIITTIWIYRYLKFSYAEKINALEKITLESKHDHELALLKSKADLKDKEIVSYQEFIDNWGKLKKNQEILEEAIKIFRLHNSRQPSAATENINNKLNNMKNID